LSTFLVRSTLLLAAALASCNQLLGIEESFVDPALGQGIPAAGEGGERNAGEAGGNAGAPSSGGAPSGGETTAAGAAGAPGSEADICAQYCALMSEHCLGDAAQYRDDAQCLKICRALPVGELDDDRVNTASCRRRYAGKARYLAGAELTTNCRYAGPGGDGRCGSNCEGLCSVTMAACRLEVSDPYYYESLDTCLLDCEGLPAAAYGYGLTSAGNSLECRLFHASSAMMNDADEHCEHALGITLCTD
jgi:hypothetical protein